jgi:hypothetical protein
MGFHKKLNELLSLRPDLLILPECAEPDILRQKAPHFAFSDCEWSGTNRNKGLGVFSFGGLSLRRHHSWERRFHLFLPVEVRGSSTMNLLAVWAFNHRGTAAVTTLEALSYYRPFLSSHAGLVAGDFNSNVIWDRTGNPNGFAAVDAALRELGLASAYHATTKAPLGKEPHGTLFFLKRVAQPYHIDYIYLPQPAAATASVTLGQPADWLALSDHVPLVADFSADFGVTPQPTIAGANTKEVSER